MNILEFSFADRCEKKVEDKDHYYLKRIPSRFLIIFHGQKWSKILSFKALNCEILKIRQNLRNFQHVIMSSVYYLLRMTSYLIYAFLSTDYLGLIYV